MKRQRAIRLFIELALVAATIWLVVTFPWESTLDDLRGRLVDWVQRQAPSVNRILPAGPAPTSDIPGPTTSGVVTTLQRIRAKNDLSTFEENQVLQKLARLLTLEAEDSGSLDQTSSTKDILRSLSPTTPQRLETISFFVPAGGRLDEEVELSVNEAVLDPQYLHIGVATRSAQFQGEAGTLLAIAFSTPFRQEVAPAPKPSAVKPTFTGQDLWVAVQNYRKAHALPEFVQSNELCTVASIRVNEILELGRLDNHDGFQAQSDAFFERNPGWRAINENLAAGYQTAVQTVEWGWDQSLGHQALIKSREFPFACTAANSGFSVLITGK